MKYLSLVLVFIVLSCGNKEDIKLSKSNVTVMADVKDHSPIYIFFRTKGKDTLAEVNRKNNIITTNWIFNIDKRLPLRLVIPEVMKLQDRKRNEKAHKSDKAENYYSYADSVKKKMAFIPFTNVYYAIGMFRKNVVIIHFKKGQKMILVDNKEVKKEVLTSYLAAIAPVYQSRIILVFDKNMPFEEYIQTKIFINKFDFHCDGLPQEYIY
jgi:biopolymer transport protein ExbD